MNRTAIGLVRRHAAGFIAGAVWASLVFSGVLYAGMARSPGLRSDVWAFWHEVTGATPQQCVITE